MSEVKILLVTCFCRVPATSSATRIIFILAKYREHPLLEKAITINKGINQANTLSCSINIFFTAGSNNQAMPDVLAATTRDKTRAIKILFICFFTYSLKSLFKIVFNS